MSMTTIMQNRTEQNSRFVGFDILKFFLAFLIVCIHCPFPGVLGEYFTAMARIAVPIFFMISGYYHVETVNQSKSNLQIKKIVILFIEANMLYFFWKMFYWVFFNDGLTEFFRHTFTLRNLLYFVFFNESPMGGHLWYLGAILYVLLIMLLIDHFKLQKLFVRLIPLLLVVDLVFGKYSLLLWRREFFYLVVRNFLFVGLPYFLIGQKLSSIHRKFNVTRLLFSCFVFVMLTFTERYFLTSIDCNAARDHYISTTFLAISVFLLIREFYSNHIPTKYEKNLAYIGKNTSTWVYIIHPIIITVLMFIFKQFDFFMLIMPLVVYILSIVLVLLFSILISKIKNILEMTNSIFKS